MSLLQRLRRRLKGPKARPKGQPDAAKAKAKAEIARLRAKLSAQAEKNTVLKRRAAIARARGFADGILQAITSQLQPGDVVVDCGANVGKVTEILAASGATVHAFEPDSHAMAILRQKFADQPNVILHQAAVSNKTGKVTFWRTEMFDQNPDRASEGNTLFQEHISVNPVNRVPVEVEMIDLAAFLTAELAKGARLRFLKIDVEGAEMDILPALLEQGLFDHIAMTVAETHETQFPQLSAEFAALRQSIAARYPSSRVNLDWI